MCSDAKQLRLSSCIQTILEVHSSLCHNQCDPGIQRRFKRLEQSLSSMEVSWISEADVTRVEEVTNSLLGELKPVFKETPSIILHTGVKH